MNNIQELLIDMRMIEVRMIEMGMAYVETKPTAIIHQATSNHSRVVHSRVDSTTIHREIHSY